MAGFRSITPSININTQSGQLRTELLNTFARLDGQLQYAPYRIATQNGPVGNTDTSETTLMSFQLDYNTLGQIGRSISFVAGGTTAANANNKTFKVKLGSSTLFSTGTLTINNKDWILYGELISNGATSQISTFTFMYNGGSPIVDTNTSSEDFGTNLTVAFTGQSGTQSDDITIYYYKATLIS